MNRKQLQIDLINWYQINHRQLPWRKDINPYHTWISEIMLQQTQVDTVIPYFNRFIERFKTIQDLAASNEEEVYKYWEGLGYYRRAKHIHEASQMIVLNHSGVFPSQYQDIIQLKGIGPYTAAAISSIAFNQPIGVVDGNVFRVISRLFTMNDNIADTKNRPLFQDQMDNLIDKKQPGLFNQAVMEIGALICRPQPRCHLCPLNPYCKAYAKKNQLLFPVNIKDRTKKEIHYIVAILENHNQELFMFKTPEGLLEKMYQFPMYEVLSHHQFEDVFNETFDSPCTITSYLGEVKHVFTHRIWHLHVYKGITNLPGYKLKDIKKLPISTVQLKVLKLNQIEGEPIENYL